jgi:predicted RNA methylase
MASEGECTCILATRCAPCSPFPPCRLFLSVQDEKDRMDIYHKILEVAREGTLHLTPIIENDHDRARILDLGCGTGIWAIDMAE